MYALYGARRGECAKKYAKIMCNNLVSNLYARQQQYRRNTNIPSFFFF